jgi:AI-2 transport protein TqsA
MAEQTQGSTQPDNGGVVSQKIIDQPFYIKAPIILLGLYLLFYGLYCLKDVMVPLFFAGLIAILLNPLVNKMVNRGLPVSIAILISLLIFSVIIGGLIFFLSSQIVQFSEMLPEMKEKLVELYHNVQTWLSEKFGFSFKMQEDMMKNATGGGQGIVGQTLGSILSFLGITFLLPVYVFLLLYYKPLIQQFIFESFNWRHSEKIATVLTETKSAIQSYVVGLLLEMAIVAALNSTALFLIGVKYALLLGCLGALLNLIPYIGGLVAIALPVLISLVTSDGYMQPIYIIGAYLLIQLVDNNFIVPKVVSSKVSVNALVSIIVVLLGGALWGVPGMFLSIPFTAVLKVIFDHIDDLKPWGKLLGDDMPDRNIVGHRLTLARRILNIYARKK